MRICAEMQWVLKLVFSTIELLFSPANVQILYRLSKCSFLLPLDIAPYFSLASDRVIE